MRPRQSLPADVCRAQAGFPAMRQRSPGAISRARRTAPHKHMGPDACLIPHSAKQCVSSPAAPSNLLYMSRNARRGEAQKQVAMDKFRTHAQCVWGHQGHVQTRPAAERCEVGRAQWGAC